MSDTLKIPDVEDQTILLFDDEPAARQFIFDKLVEAGEIEVHRGDVFIVGDESWNTQDEAIDAVTDDFGSIEFFHAYKAEDRRVCQNAKGER